jgi:acetyl esterase
MEVFTKDYLNSHEDSFDSRASPLAIRDVSIFPPCFILTAGFDPLRDEGEAFALKLHNQGVKVSLKRYPNCLHAFFGLKDFGKMGLLAVEDVAAYLKDQPISQLSRMP